MATQKLSGIRLGAGNLAQKNGEAEVIVNTRLPYSGRLDGIAEWVNSTPYSYDQPVTYKGIQYKSTIPGSSSNTGNVPTVSGWTQVDGKDGDIWVQVPPGATYSTSSGSVGIFQKINGVWSALSASSALGVKLSNNSTGVCLTFVGLSFPYAEIRYTLRRQIYPEVTPNYAQSRQGVFIVQNDGSNITHSHEYQDFGNDVGCTLTPSLNSSNVIFTYVSDDQGKPLEFKFSISGWGTANLS